MEVAVRLATLATPTSASPIPVTLASMIPNITARETTVILGVLAIMTAHMIWQVPVKSGDTRQ